jgi:hypothetical protein
MGKGREGKEEKQERRREENRGVPERVRGRAQGASGGRVLG